MLLGVAAAFIGIIGTVTAAIAILSVIILPFAYVYLYFKYTVLNKFSPKNLNKKGQESFKATPCVIYDFPMTSGRPVKVTVYLSHSEDGGKLEEHYRINGLEYKRELNSKKWFELNSETNTWVNI